MLLAAAALVLTVAVPLSAPAAYAPDPPRGVQAAARATVEILTVARGQAEAAPGEPQRKLRRSADGRAIVEFE